MWIRKYALFGALLAFDCPAQAQSVINNSNSYTVVKEALTALEDAAKKLEQNLDLLAVPLLRIVLFTRWDESDIPVCWENPSVVDQVERAWVQDDVANSWGSVTNVRFIGWGKCAGVENGIRIKIADEQAITNALGKNLRDVHNGMMLNLMFLKTSSDCLAMKRHCIKAVTVHEFGHALGFSHEQGHPKAPARCRVKAGRDKAVELTDWEPHSIMNTCDEKWWQGRGELTDDDRRGMRCVYAGKNECIPRK